MSTARNVLSNTAYQLLGRFSMAAMAVIILKLITGYLGVAGYGEYVTIYEYLGIFAIFADMGIYTIAIREMSIHEEKRQTIFGNIMGLRATLAVIMLGLAAVTAFLLPQYYNSRIPVGITIAALTTFFTMLQGTVCSVLQVYYKMQYSTIAMVTGKFLSVLYTLFVIFYLFPRAGVDAAIANMAAMQVGNGMVVTASLPLEMGFWHLIFGGLIGSVVMYVISSHYVQKFMSFRYEFDIQYWIDVLKTAVPYGLALILNNIYFKVDVLLLSLILPGEAANIQVGMYGVAMRILEMLVIIPVYFMNSVLPIMMKHIREKSDKIHQVIQFSFEFLAAASFPILVGIGLLATEIVELISTEEFSASGDLGSHTALRILMFALVFSFLNSLFGFMLVAVEKQIKLLWINSLCVIINVAANIFIIPLFGFVGASWTSVLSETFIFIATFIAAKKYLPFSFTYTPVLKTALSAVGMGVVIVLLKPYLPGKFWVLLIPIGAAVYFAGILATGAINKEMREMLKKKA